jgi:tetraacyldisaccharide 4'-kinase
MDALLPLTALGGVAGPLWNAAAAVRVRLYKSGWIRQKRLAAKVVSVGNIAWGGTGKTPFVIWLADHLTAAGLRVSILTRGYRRASRESVRILPAGAAPADAARDGDEVQLYLRHLKNVPVGVSASRYEAGRHLEEWFPVDVHLLDDGFQHMALARDLDLVLIDASNPWGARAGFPRLLRESPRALRRAGAIVLTRSDSAGRSKLDSLRGTLRALNSSATQFLASTGLLRLVSADGRVSRTAEQMRAMRCAAFCGIGNPQEFFALMERGGIQCVGQRRFGDHHRYASVDFQLIERLAREAKADCLVTTEKDLVNLGEHTRFSVPLYWTEIATAVEQEEKFLAWLAERLGIQLADPARHPNTPIAQALNR